MCLSVSTPSTRWMPPCRSRPRLIVRCGGERDQTEARNTTAARVTPHPRVLGILFVLWLPRSEEGRGGEKGRSRWAPDHLKKKKHLGNTNESVQITERRHATPHLDSKHT